jgi:hypothetical protein
VPKLDQFSERNPVPNAGPTPIPWASSRGEFLIAIQACGCQVKVRDAAAAERMATTVCRKHAS